MTKIIPRLRTKYEKEIIGKLLSEFGIKNRMDVPKMEKIVVNSGIGDAIKNKEIIEKVKLDLALITGQAPSLRRARVSVASFGVRQGMPVGMKVTLRDDKMYSFLDKLISVVMPRLRDFRGVPAKSFDKSGNYTLGMAEYGVFPEIDITKSGSRGLEITIVTNTNDLERSRKLLEYLGLPFEKDSTENKVHSA